MENQTYLQISELAPETMDYNTFKRNFATACLKAFEGSSAESLGKPLKSSSSKQPLTMLGASQTAGGTDSPTFSRVAFSGVCFFPFTVTKVYDVPYFDSELSYQQRTLNSLPALT